MKLKIIALMFIFSMIPIFEIIAHPDKEFVTYRYEDGYVHFDLNPETDVNQYHPLDVGIMVFRDGLLGMIPRTNENGRFQFPLIINLISLTTETASMIMDPILSHVSQYIPFWTYNPTEETVVTYNYTVYGTWNSYENRGALNQIWHITDDPYRSSWWQPDQYIIYVPYENHYYKGIYLFGRPTVTNSTPLTPSQIETYLLDMGYMTQETGGETWIPYIKAYSTS